jgi:RNA polymerase sigma-70 factor (ECF subfamily)
MNEESAPPDDSTLDQTLIARWRDGDERAASQLVERHANQVARYLQSLGARDEVGELVQDTFVRAFASLGSFRGDSSLRTWILTIARRLLVDSRRAFRRRRDTELVEEGDAVTAYDALDGLIAGESGRRVLDAVQRLSPTQREVFSLRAGEGRSYREIAEIVGTTEGAARVHYHNAVRTVKENLYV